MIFFDKLLHADFLPIIVVHSLSLHFIELVLFFLSFLVLCFLSTDEDLRVETF